MAMLAAGMPHALLFVGPASVGKTTLALDVAAAELCQDPDPAVRPCRTCRSCRLIESGNHPDLHRLAPAGAGSTIGIDAIRELIGDLALLPVEGGARVALIESAHRLTEDAQNALLKTLEEPPSGVTLLLCADDEERLLPTIQSRVNRIRLGPLPVRAIEELLEEQAGVDAPTASRLARLSAGRPGLALAYARAPDAATIRGELSRSLLDLAGSRRAVRLARIRELQARAGELAAALQPPSDDTGNTRTTRGRRAGGRGSAAVAAPATVTAPTEPTPAPAEADGSDGSAGPSVAPAGKASPAERRRAALALLDVWRDVARDVALISIGEPAAISQPDLLEELDGIATGLPAGSAGAFLSRLDQAALLIEFNANPELALDSLALAWPRPARAA
jgi:DNA polymerase III delta' subunit